VLDEFRHVTIGLEMSTAALTGAKFDYNARMKADEGKRKTRTSAVAEMEAAIRCVIRGRRRRRLCGRGKHVAAPDKTLPAIIRVYGCYALTWRSVCSFR